jgi:hypothetical protein
MLMVGCGASINWMQTHSTSRTMVPRHFVSCRQCLPIRDYRAGQLRLPFNSRRHTADASRDRKLARLACRVVLIEAGPVLRDGGVLALKKPMRRAATLRSTTENMWARCDGAVVEELLMATAAGRGHHNVRRHNC